MSEKDMRSILYAMSNDHICNAAVMLNNEEIFESTYTTLEEVDLDCLMGCNNKNIIETLVGRISNELANELFMDLIKKKDVVNELLFDALIRSGRVLIDKRLFSELIKKDHVYGIKYFLRNGFDDVTINAFQEAILSNSLRAMDILFPYVTISDLKIKGFISKKFDNMDIKAMRTMLDRLREYGYDLFGKFLALKRLEKDKMSRRIYAYLHDHGVYYDRVILRKMKLIYASNKTYWRVPEKDRQLFLNKLSETTHELYEIPYAKKLMVVSKLCDIAIVCSLD